MVTYILRSFVLELDGFLFELFLSSPFFVVFPNLFLLKGFLVGWKSHLRPFPLVFPVFVCAFPVLKFAEVDSSAFPVLFPSGGACPGGSFLSRLELI